MENFTVNAFKLIDGKEVLMAWATGLNKKGAKAIFQQYYDEGFAIVRMRPTVLAEEAV